MTASMSAPTDEKGAVPATSEARADRPPETPATRSQGLFLTFEGIDGAGKSSHIAGLAEAFGRDGRTVCTTREPGGTPLAEKIRALFLHDEMDALTESLLVFAARRDHIRCVIKPALARGEVVLCDRFTDASFAYQGGGRGFDVPVLSVLERWVQTQSDGDAILQPDCTLWFDLPAEMAAARLAIARQADRFEGQALEFFQRVAAAYAERAAADSDRFTRIDAALSRDAVAAAVRDALVARGWLRPMSTS
jgi:dTMP kinase